MLASVKVRKAESDGVPGRQGPPVITAEEAREILDYDPETGIIRWKNHAAPKAVRGAIAGNGQGVGYIRIRIHKRSYLAHRLAWLIMTGSWPEVGIDHINGEQDCNSWSNLRAVTQQENQRNTAIGTTNTSGYIGVSWSKTYGKWVAGIRVDGKTIFLGHFSDIEEAASARKVGEKKYGFHVNHGRAPFTAKKTKSKKCRVASCGASFVPQRLGQAVCSPACAIKDAPANRDKAHKALADVGRREIRVRKEKLKSRADHLADTQKAFNAWIRERDIGLPCVSCGRHHNGQWQAGHFKSVGGHPALRYEPLNVWRQCAPCNTHKSGDLLNYRVELVQRIGLEKVEWLEGPHEPKKYTVDDLKAMTADYRSKTKELKRAAA